MLQGQRARATARVLRQRGNYQDDYVNAYGLDAQAQITLQTDYLHGRLSPRLTYIQFVQGTAALHPTLTYRWNDWLLFQADYQYITAPTSRWASSATAIRWRCG